MITSFTDSEDEQPVTFEVMSNLQATSGLENWYLKNPDAEHVPTITRDIEQLHQAFKINKQ